MNLIIQILGLIFNIYIMFQLVVSQTYEKTKETGKGSLINNEMDYTNIMRHRSQNSNKQQTLSRIVQQLLILYIIIDMQLIINMENISSVMNFDISQMDGTYKITKTKIAIEIYIQIMAQIIINIQKGYHYDQKNSTYNEIYLILQTNVLGISSLIASNDWLITIISWELFNLSLYLLVSLNSYSESALSSSLKYFLLSALSTAFLLLGVSIIYYTVGSTNYDHIVISMQQLIQMGESNGINMITIGTIQILITILFKLSAAPLHNWAPDLYDGLHTNVTTWMIIIPKVTVFFLQAQLSKEHLLISTLIENYKAYSIEMLLLGSGLLSIMVGSIALNNQWKIKRFFAYSGVSHVGFILLALYSYDLHAYMIYVVIYGITTINIFSCLILLSKYQGKEIKYMSQQMGTSGLNPFIIFALTISLFSLAGKGMPAA